MPEGIAINETKNDFPTNTGNGGNSRRESLLKQDLAAYMAKAAEMVKAPSESDAFALIRLDREMKYCQECKGLAACQLKGMQPVATASGGRIYLTYRPCKRARSANAERRMKAALKAARLPENLSDKTINGFEKTEGTEVARQAAIEIGQRILNGNLPLKGLMLMGPPGVGKSHLEVALARVALEAGCYTVFVSLPDLIDASRKWFATKTGLDPAEVVIAADVAILDDLGAESTKYEWVAERVFQVLDQRMRNRKLTFVTTNLTDPDEISSHYGGLMGRRIVSRLAELCRWITMTGPDWRLRQVM
ncbi:ATP-binding protein [Acetomicrobium sp. S15 = DSM 107314]|uniref:ATP-binding protein n=1 Tax=Acetomicrobium sp. S15 = DSM 107314 TaxID=2529858 RepID=UPI0018E1361F|nr:ATP-binding protein [Acetomicrobium sp. S15 = DSM 107314]